MDDVVRVSGTVSGWIEDSDPERDSCRSEIVLDCFIEWGISSPFLGLSGDELSLFVAALGVEGILSVSIPSLLVWRVVIVCIQDDV